ncbi:MAG: hypothetical protein JNJ82_03915 [Opitutaceae bacterium]|nr:hypothetical protein [Opitutaceae bacterium]
MKHSLRLRLSVWAVFALLLAAGRLLSHAQAMPPGPSGKVRAAKIFGSHMVLQHGQPIDVWGVGPPGDSVTVTFGLETASTRVAPSGSWSVRLAARGPSDKPENLVINAETFHDVLVGDVWLCSGQSNMGYNLRLTPRGKQDRVSAANPLVRIAHHSTPRSVAPDGYTQAELERSNTRDFFACNWIIDTDKATDDASAVAWYFGHRLQPAIGIPVGLVTVAVGGSALNNWIPESALRQHPESATLYTSDWLHHPDVKPQHQARARDAFKHLLKPGEPYLAGRMPYRWMCEPAFLFEAGIQPLQALKVKGVIWYQGESEAGSERKVALASELLPLLVNTWRANFRSPDLPWLMVQLPAHNMPYWPAFREVQRQFTSSIGHAALAVTIDLGSKDDVHPANKEPIGSRLARLALRDSYGRSDVNAFPTVSAVRVAGERLQIEVSDCPGGLLATTGSVAGFEVQDANGAFRPTKALLINPTTIEIEGAGSSTQIRYLWSGFPEPAPQLFSKEGLPLGPFLLPVPSATALSH